jgi:Zn-dependent protease
VSNPPAHVLGKLKFLLIGLTKASTFISMFAFFGVYWSAYGWPLALGLVLSIYIHEMGHVAMLRGLGIDAGAPMFIPGVGAVVMLKQHVQDPLTDAKIGLAGPVWGLGAAIVALVSMA